MIPFKKLMILAVLFVCIALTTGIIFLKKEKTIQKRTLESSTTKIEKQIADAIPFNISSLVTSLVSNI